MVRDVLNPSAPARIAAAVISRIAAQQLRVKAGNARFKLLDMRHDLDQNKSMRGCDLLGLQGLKDVFPAGTQAIAGQAHRIAFLYKGEKPD